MSEASYKTIQEKMIGPETLPIDSLIVSEYNTRCSFVEQGHVEHLAKLIRERGFNPTRPLLVNVIRNAAGEIIAQRLVAGLHRYEGSRMAELSAIPCILYEGLTPEEETLLDRWDNEMDEEHKPVHFLAEAEHYKYLMEKKGWSQRQLAQVKGVSRTTVRWKLQIATLPEEIKALVSSGQHVAHLAERHVLEICKLNVPGHMMLIIKEIIERGSGEEEVEGGGMKSSVKQSEVEAMVKELLEIESRGKVSPKVRGLIQEVEEAEDEAQPARCLEGDTGSRGRPEPPQLPAHTTRQGTQEPEMELPNEEQAALTQLRLEREEQMRRERDEPLANLEPLGVPSEKRTTDTMKFDVMPRWLKFSSLPHRMKSQWALLRALIEYEMRYKHNATSSLEEGGYFYIGGSLGTPARTYELLARVVGLQSAETVKKKLRGLVKQGYLKMVHAELPRYPQFTLLWEKLKEVYDAEAWEIPFEEGGLDGIPPDFNGTILPTPTHTIWVRDGIVRKGMDYALAQTMTQLKQIGATKKFIQKLLVEHPFGAIWEALKSYERQKAAPKENGAAKQRPIDVLLGFLKGRTPQN